MSRILTLQRQVRELGRLRTGYTTGNRPVRSKTWIITSKEKELLDAAAGLWGGKVVEWTPLNSDLKQWSLTTETDRLPAFLPPGDPLTQANEMWSRGGVTRRCNGLVDLKSGQACVCRARFGDDFHTRPQTEVCKPYTRLNVMLLDLPDLGVWHHTTKSYYAAMEIAGMVDFIKARIGPEPTVPVWLIIDQRKKVADGKTTPYPVPVITIRGGESAAELLAGNVPTLELGPSREQAAIGGARRQAIGGAAEAQPDWLELVEQADTMDAVNNLRDRMKTAGVSDPALVEAWKAKAATLSAPARASRPARTATPAESAPAPADEYEAEVEGESEPDGEQIWNEVVVLAGKLGWNMPTLAEKYQKRMGFDYRDDKSDGWALARFRDGLKAGQVQ